MTRRTTVFISYAKDDLMWAEAIAQQLQEAGEQVWFDTRQFEVGDTWQSDLRKALSEASTVLVIVSAKAASSQWVQFEAGAALAAAAEERTRLVPIYLSHKGEDYFPLFRGLAGINVTGLRPEEAARRVAEFVAADA